MQGINTVTKSGTNKYKASLYSFMRNENLVGNTVSGNKVVANPSLSFNQSGFTASGPIIPNTLFVFMNAEIERREDPGSNFAANRGTSAFGISRVKASDMDRIKQRMISAYGYDPGVYENYTNRWKMKNSSLNWIGILMKATTLLLDIITLMLSAIYRLILSQLV